MSVKQLFLVKMGVYMALALCPLAVMGQSTSTLQIKDRPPQQNIQSWDKAGRNERLAIVDALVEKRAESLLALRTALTTGTLPQRTLACELLYEMRDKDSVELLITVTQRPETQLHCGAINALREIGDSRAAPRMRDILKGRGLDESKKICTLVAMGRLGTNKDIPLLRDFLKDTSPAVQTAAAGAISMLGSSEAQDVLIQMTESNDPFTQKLAIKSLGYLDTPDSTDHLNTILQNPSADWKNYARISIEQQRLKKEKSDGERLQTLSRLASSENKWMSEWAIGQIADMDTRESRQELLRLSKANIRYAAQAKRTLSLRGGSAQ